jgi:hypothetical protein
MANHTPSAGTVGRKLGHEMQQFILIFAYLYVFGALIGYKMAILSAQGISYTPYGLAAIKALVLAKFILMGMRSEWEIDTRGADSYTSSCISRSCFYLCCWFSRLLRKQSSGSSMGG